MGAARRASLWSQAGKWLGFVTAVWVQSISGNNYTFSNYSDALKSLMGLTQLQLNNLSVAKDVGKAFGIFAGLASDRLPTSVILLIGSLEGLVGYGAQYLVVRQTIRPLPYWQMCIFLCMGGNSTTWMNTAVLVTCIRNFRKNRGPVSGILKGYVGLSTAIFTDVCTALFSDSPSSFLLMLALIPAAVCLIAMLFLREVPASTDSSDSTEEEDREEGRYFAIFNGVAVVLAVYLLAFDLSGRHSAVVSQAFAVGLLVLLATPLGFPFHLWYRSLSAKSREVSADVEAAITTPLLAGETTSAVERREQEGGAVAEEGDMGAANANVEVSSAVAAGRRNEEAEGMQRRPPALGEEHTIGEVVRSLDFWVLFVSFLCGVGTGLAVMNNMGQMGLAMGYADVSIFVSMISIWGFFGRIGSGIISEHFFRKAGTPRPLWNAASQLLMTVGYVVMAMALPGSLYIGSIVVGICYGARIAVTVPTASELFGLRYYGLIYNILILNLPLGSFLFSGLLAGLLYDAQATRTAGGGNTCVGAHCYRLVFVIMAVACVVGFGLDVLLAFRTKSLYAKINLARRSRRTAAKRSEPIKD
ncbi:hypothetical protein Taro_030971 [Colocasia esculenta]|uniref:Nodulin-like domain-containing protein n=1 Tax=Colocasia esculenta TaxID=4460 RepID=A0A843VTD4_COLES|nr:hypothetical protein [Colocasia esculenta]